MLIEKHTNAKGIERAEVNADEISSILEQLFKNEPIVRAFGLDGKFIFTLTSSTSIVKIYCCDSEQYYSIFEEVMYFNRG